jgi:hypothetical protein
LAASKLKNASPAGERIRNGCSPMPSWSDIGETGYCPEGNYYQALSAA